MRKSNFVSLARVLASIRPDVSPVFLPDDMATWQAVVETLADWCESRAKPGHADKGERFKREVFIADCNGQYGRYCFQCRGRFDKADIDGGRCLSCGTMICAEVRQ
jgi:hypothetical protein